MHFRWWPAERLAGSSPVTAIGLGSESGLSASHGTVSPAGTYQFSNLVGIDNASACRVDATPGTGGSD
ncbi:hypothetical protein NSERUTF1_6749 [Nocardia seriolae]|nr:hypothetical protein NSERUTF1_6749 [Nocardia seriolae]